MKSIKKNGFTTISKLVSPLRSEISRAFLRISKLVVAKCGFTTIELLAFTMVLVVVSSLVAGILFTTLRGSTKAKIGGTVAQNGNYALSVMTDIITSSDAITEINGVAASSCVPPQGQTAPPISSIQFHRNDGGLTTLSCSPSSSGTIASVSAGLNIPLVDSSQVEVADCSSFLICTQTDPYSYPIINIKFKLQDKNNNPKIIESSFSSDFNTSVSMRNYRP